MSDWYLGQLAAQDEYGDVPLPRPGPRTENRNAAQVDLNMTPEERDLYDRHLSNLWGTGGVDNPDGSRSTLFQAGTNVGGREYNIPTVYDGRKLPFDEALARAKQQGIDKFPSYPTVEASEARYDQMHGYMDRDTGQYFEQHPQDPFERAAQRVRAPYRNLPAPGSNRIGQLAEQITSMPSWLDVATQQMARDKEAFQTGGIGSLLADTSVAQELAGGFGGGGFAGRTKNVGAPAIVSRASPTMGDIAAIKEAAVGYGRKGWPDATREVFKTTPEAYAETAKLVPQVSIKDRLPGPLAGEKLPNKGRADPIVSNTDAIAERIAQRLAPWVEQGDPRLKFYHTAPVIRGLEKNAGMSVPEANTFMRGWAGQGAATSPRTQTPPNLRNSSYLMYERARGEPLTPERYKREGNIPGFPMMGMHVDLADKFARGTEKAWSNPKPTTFRENWSGNLRDVTGDTHNIRSTLYEMDQVKPGSLPRGWFTTDDAFKKYKKEGFASIDAGDIVDTLGTKTVDKVSRQSEYLPMTAPWYGAAEKLGVAPAEVQSGGWFNYGGITGLQSPPKTITNLLNDQVDATARAINQPPEKVVEWWARGKIPLAGVGGAAALTPEVLGSIAAQDEYR